MPRHIALSLLVAFATLLLTVPSSTGWAQSEKVKKAKAVKLLAKGDKLLGKGDRLMDQGKMEKALEAYEEALSLYNEAYEAFPNPKIYFPIALAEQKLGRYMESMNHYQTMLKEGQDFGEEVIEQVEASIEEVKKNLVAIDLVIEQDGAEVKVDGDVIGTSPLDGPHWMPPGRHKYTVTLEGFIAIEQEVDLMPGDVKSLDIKMEKVPVKIVKKPEPEPEPIKIVKPSKTPMVVSYAAAGTFFVGATTFAFLAKNKSDRFNDENLSDSAREKARAKGKSYALFTDILAVSTIAAAAYGTYYYYTEVEGGGKEELAKSADNSDMWVAPYASADGGGVALGMSF